MKPHDIEQIRSVLYQLFFSLDKAPGLLDTFIESQVYEHRRSISSSNILGNEIVLPANDFPESYSVADYCPQLGSYERQLIQFIRFSGNGPTMIRGGTGSGKSALVSRLRGYFYSLTKKHKLNESLGISSIYSVIDLQGIENKLSVDVKIEEKDKVVRLGDLKECLTNRFKENIANLFTLYGDDVSSVPKRMVKLIDQAVHSVNADFPHMHRSIRGSLRHLKTYLEAEGINVSDYDSATSDTLMSIYGVINDCFRQNGKLVFYLYLYSLIAKNIKGKNQDLCFILVLDNSDRINPALSTIYQELTVIINTNRLALTGLRLVGFVRYSTSELDSIAAISNDSVKSHLCPKPSSIITYRITNFLLKPDSFKEMESLCRSDAIWLLKRILAFWVNLHDSHSDFHEVINSLSGTNIRNAFEHAIKWIADPEGRVSRQQFNEKERENVRNLISTKTSRQHILLTIHRVITGIWYQLHEDYIESILRYSKGDSSLASKEIIDVISKVVLDVVNDDVCCQECYVGDAPDASIQYYLIKEAQKYVSNINDNEKKKLYNQASIELNQIVNCILKRIVESDNEGSKLLNNITKHLNDKLSSCLKNAVNASMQHESSRKYYHLIIDALAVLITKNSIHFSNTQPYSILTKKPISREPLLDDARYFYKKNIDGRLPNRYSCITNLFDSAAIGSDGAHSYQAINLFKTQGNNHSLDCLFILYHLIPSASDIEKKSEYYNEVGLVIDTLKNYGVKKKSLFDALRFLVQKDKRLIISGVADEHYGMQEWEQKRNRHMHVTWTGECYYEYLLTTPYYIRWALSKLDDLTIGYEIETKRTYNNKDFFESNRFVLWAFRMLFDTELRKIKRMKKKLYSKYKKEDFYPAFIETSFLASPLHQRSVISDIFHRSMIEFDDLFITYSANVNARNAHNDKTDAAHLTQAIYDMRNDRLKLSCSMRDEIRKIFGDNNYPYYWDDYYTFLKERYDGGLAG